MAYDIASANHQLIRRDLFAQLGDATSRTDKATSTYLYNYRTTDVAATVEGANYFDAATWLQTGDVINAVMNSGDGQTPVYKQYIVTAGVASGAAHNAITLQTGTAG